MPHSYNFSGQTYVFPRSDVHRLDVNSSDMMAFIVSGGVTEMPQLFGALPAPKGAAPIETPSDGSDVPG